MGEHTPGPWIVLEHESEDRAVVGTEGGMTLWFYSHPQFATNIGAALTKADARLIAAAPDLLALVQDGLLLFCREVEDGITDSFGDFMFMSEEWCDRAEATIAKATGKNV